MRKSEGKSVRSGSEGSKEREGGFGNGGEEGKGSEGGLAWEGVRVSGPSESSVGSSSVAPAASRL